VVERSTWTAANIQAVLPGILTPLTWSLLREQWRHAYHKVFLGTHTLRDASVEFVALFYNRPFLNVSALRRVAARALGTSPAGLVVDVGGPLSHGAIVAREYRLPAVVHVKEATRLVRTGQTITINGATGEVWVE
jgi:PEP-utilising enzyme, mobile domain